MAANEKDRESGEYESARAREIEAAQRKQSESRLEAVADETRVRVDAALKSFIEDTDLPEDDSKVHNLRELGVKRGVEFRQPEPACSKPPAADVPTKPSAKTLAESRAEPDWRYPPVSPNPDSPAKILVIDDDRDTVSTLVEHLGQHGYRVAQAFDGFEGIQQLQKLSKHPTDPKPCDVILLDWRMPRVSGEEFLNWLMKSPYWHIPVLIISGAKPPRDDREWSDRFVFVGKPLNLDALFSAVESAIKESRGTK